MEKLLILKLHYFRALPPLTTSSVSSLPLSHVRAGTSCLGDHCVTPAPLWLSQNQNTVYTWWMTFHHNSLCLHGLRVSLVTSFMSSPRTCPYLTPQELEPFHDPAPKHLQAGIVQVQMRLPHACRPCGLYKIGSQHLRSFSSAVGHRAM